VKLFEGMMSPPKSSVIPRIAESVLSRNMIGCDYEIEWSKIESNQEIIVDRSSAFRNMIGFGFLTHKIQSINNRKKE
jgi:ribosomal protein S17E